MGFSLLQVRKQTSRDVLESGERGARGVSEGQAVD